MWQTSPHAQPLMRFLSVRPEVYPWVTKFPHPASFRFHLTMDTLVFSYSFPLPDRLGTYTFKKRAPKVRHYEKDEELSPSFLKYEYTSISDFSSPLLYQTHPKFPDRVPSSPDLLPVSTPLWQLPKSHHEPEVNNPTPEL